MSLGKNGGSFCTPDPSLIAHGQGSPERSKHPLLPAMPWGSKLQEPVSHCSHKFWSPSPLGQEPSWQRSSARATQDTSEDGQEQPEDRKAIRQQVGKSSKHIVKHFHTGVITEHLLGSITLCLCYTLLLPGVLGSRQPQLLCRIHQ